MAQVDSFINNNSSSPSKFDSTSTITTKLCHIIKRPDFDGYGFNLHSEKSKPGQFIGKVDANSPADYAGLKEGDRIIKVNDVSIENESHKQVVQRIKAISHEVRLLLVADSGPSTEDVSNGKYNDQCNQNVTDFEETAQNMQTETTNKTTVPNENNSNGNNVNINSQKVGSLQLPITAAEMRAKLLMKKKYDPKNESVDLKKKFEIIQKL